MHTDIPDAILAKWQQIVDLIARLVGVPAGLIMRLSGEEIEVLVTSQTPGNPYKQGDRERLQGSGLYCEAVTQNQDGVLVANALTSDLWKNNPDLKFGMISYFGLPIQWPDKKPFGTICILDRKENSYDEAYQLLLRQFRDVIETHLGLLFSEAQQKEDRVQLENLTARLHLATGANDLGVWDFDLRTGHVIWDERMHEIYGVSQDDFGHRIENWVQLLHPDDAPWVLEKLRQMGFPGANPKEKSRPFRIITPAGEIRWLTSAFFVLKDASDLPLRAVGTTQDVTHSHGLAQELEQTCHDLKAAEKLAGVGSWTWDVLEDRIAWSEGIYDLWALDPSQPPPSFAEHRHLMSEDSFLRLGECVAQCKKSGIPYVIELECLRRGNDHFFMVAQGKAARDAHGRIVGLLGTVQDITKLKLLQHQLIQQNAVLEAETARAHEASRQKSDFLAHMSHELRTPLNGIIGFTEFLHDEKSGPLNPAQRDFLQDVLKSAYHLLKLINTLLDIAKIEAGRMEVAPETFSLHEAITEVSNVLRPLVEESRISLTTRLDLPEDRVCLDPQKIRQVLYNLLSNAIKFTDEQGRVEIRTRLTFPDRIEVTVQDSGIGISKEDFPKLFGEFQQLGSDPEHHRRGTGLGLALTKKLVTLHGGTIEVESILGKGTTFTVNLPRFVSNERKL